jgi:hypothetical protein
MNRKEIEKKRKELVEILKEQETSTRLEKLQTLAKEVGASVTRMERGRLITDSSGRITSEEMSRNAITETEIVYNIQVALQTETMLHMSKTAARNWIIAVIASAVGFLSTVAAWLAALAAWWAR